MLRKRMLAGIAASGLLALTLAAIPNASLASSHREAPLISKDPDADNTDLYAFRSPDRPDTVTMVANYIPLEEPAGGPNFSSFGDDVLYEIKVSNTSDAKDDLVYQFRFHSQTSNPNTFLYNTGPVTSLNDNNLNVSQSYSVTRVTEQNGHEVDQDVLGTNIPVVPANIGPRSTPNYGALAAAAVKNLPGGIKVFAGPRADPFFVDLGSIFDLGGLRPFNKLHLIPLDTEPGVNVLNGFNVHSIVIQVPINQLTRDHKRADQTKTPVIGVYATASRQKLRVLNGDGTVSNHGSWVQISRLGYPLINEVIIPLGKKDFWNSTDPEQDAQFQKFYQAPELAGLINVLYPPLNKNIPTTKRDDLTAVLLTGVPGLNFLGNTPADLLRLNVSIPPAAKPSRLGVLDGDFAGFPNGRRLADDVVDIEIRAVACGYGPALHTALGLCDLSPNDQLGDGVDASANPLLDHFPYVALPIQGYESQIHHAMSKLQ